MTAPETSAAERPPESSAVPTRSEIATPDIQSDEDARPVTLSELANRQQSSPLPIPIQNPSVLPLDVLDPEVLERVVAEVVAGQHNLGAQFYGRRGQAQFGLDIIERERTGARTLYQVKRYAELTPAKIRGAVEDYAAAPRSPGHAEPLRKFAPTRFVVVTSARLDHDTKNVDEVAALQNEYAGDLAVEVWGAEALSRKLRPRPHLVYAVFGPDWARAYCGYDPGPRPAPGPRPLGLVEDPIDVLRLRSLEADASAAESDEPERVASVYATIAAELDRAGFVGDASSMKRRESEALRKAGQHGRAFQVLLDIVLRRIEAADRYTLQPVQQALEEAAAAAGELERATFQIVRSIADWSERGSGLDAAVPALRLLVAEASTDAAVLACHVIEGAIVDNLFDFDPPRSIMVEATGETSQHLRELVSLCTQVDDPDPIIRARLRCAIADARLLLTASDEEVEAAYRPVLEEALAGGLLEARGLVASRAAYAFAVRGAVEKAVSLWRNSVLSNSEDRFYGDVRAALRSVDYALAEIGQFGVGMAKQVAALPDRTRILASAADPALAALESAHDNKLPDALGDTRRYLRRERLSGNLLDEALAYRLLGDVLRAANQLDPSVEAYILGGAPKQAGEAAATLPELLDVDIWLTQRLRRRKAAAVDVMRAQVLLTPDSAIPERVTALLIEANSVWGAPVFPPSPELGAIKAIAAFGFRVPAAAVADIISLAEPATTRPTGVSADVADLLIQTYWAVPTRRAEIAATISQLLELETPPHNLWDKIRGVPAEAREELRTTVTRLGELGRTGALMSLADWREPTRAVQFAARMAASSLLRRPIGPQDSQVVGTQESETVVLLLALLSCPADELVAVEEQQLSRERSWSAGGVLYSTSFVTAPGLTPRANEGADAGSPAEEADEVDTAAIAAAQSPHDVAGAVARKLVSLGEDEHQGAATRVNCLSALYRLIPELDSDVLLHIGGCLVPLAVDPRLNEHDLMELESNSPLSRFRFGTSAGHLSATALLVAATSLRRAHELGESVELNAEFRDFALSSAATYLRDDDALSRRYGAQTISAIAPVDAGVHAMLVGLLFHPDERVRTIGVASADVPQTMLVSLATDPSADVRASVARRHTELPTDIVDLLAGDPDLRVRAQLPTS